MLIIMNIGKGVILRYVGIDQLVLMVSDRLSSKILEINSVW